MIDYFALALSHALILIALLRILARDDLDREDAAPAGSASARDAKAGTRSSRRPKGKAGNR